MLSNKNPNKGGQLWFMAAAGDPPSDTLTLMLPGDGSEVPFFVAGKFDQTTGKAFPSAEDKDTVIKVVDANSSDTLGEMALMVRVRKNANTLTNGERDRFLSALVQLNQANEFVTLQNMHVQSASDEIHGRSCFLPWHRSYLLDLERKLQQIDPSVSLPYWKFDEKAEKIFIPDFMGVPDNTGMVSFSNTNPLINWKLKLFGVGSGARVRRYNNSNGVNWDPTMQGAIAVQNNEQQTINLGNIFADFASPSAIEIDPHGMAHVSFFGQVSNIGMAPADPLFFLLHNNIDRLWAKWQWINDLFVSTDIKAYPNQGNGDPDLQFQDETGIGNFTKDSMWPWNGIKTKPRPNTAPGTGLPGSPITVLPGKKPLLEAMIDFHGQKNISSHLNFAYDDIPYDF
jgi:tyrosinase